MRYFQSKEEVPNYYESISSSTNNLFIIRWELNTCNRAWMSSTFSYKGTVSEVVNSKNSKLSTSDKIFVIVWNAYWHELIWFSSVWTALINSFSLRFPKIPLCNFSLLTYTHKFIVILGGNTEAIHTAHSLCMISHSLFILKIPSKNSLISSTTKKMNIIREYLNLSYFTCMFFQMRN